MYSTMDIIFLAGTVLVLSTCVLTEEAPHMRCMPTNGTCDSKCEQAGGRCMEQKCCFNEDYYCFPTNGTCASICPEKGGVCKEDKCCIRKEPPHMRCVPTNGTCGSRCEQAGGRCEEQKCCFSDGFRCFPTNGTCGSICAEKGGVCNGDMCCIRTHMRCVHTNGTCGDRCLQHHGRCVDDNKCCFHRPESESNEDDDNDYDEHDDDDDDDDDAAADDDDDDDESLNEDDDDESSEDKSRDGKCEDYEGAKFRCTKLNCTGQLCKEKGGFCMEGKCCFKKPEYEGKSSCKEERRLHEEREKRRNDGSHSDVVRVNCTADGSFLARCRGLECHCLNASSGAVVGVSRRVASLDKINCDEVQSNTKAERVNVQVTVTQKSMDEFRKSELGEIKRQLGCAIESMFPVKTKINLKRGSIIADIELEQCKENCLAPANPVDMYTVGTAVVSELQQETIVLEVNGQTMTPTDAAISQITTTEMLVAMENEVDIKLKDTENNMTAVVIAVVGVAVVVMLLSAASVCYFYSRYKRRKVAEPFFSDIQGKDNPVYMKA